MKKVLFSVVLLFAATSAFAQMESVKKAKSMANGVSTDLATNFGAKPEDLAKKGAELDNAEALINQALSAPETKDLAETWNVAGFIQQKKKELESLKTSQPDFNPLPLYNSVLSMCKYYFKCDELAQKPDEKGKIKNKYRKSNVATILENTSRGNLINGGIQYYNDAFSKEGDEAKEYNRKAMEFFGTYVDIAFSPMFASENLQQTDTLLAQIAYYAADAASKVEDNANVVKYAQYAQGDPEYGKNAMALVSDGLKAQGDTAKWVASLKEGLQKYPEHQYFFGNLFDYYNNKNMDAEALQLVDEMLAKDPSSSFYLYVKALYYEGRKDYDNAIVFYQKAIDADPNYAEAITRLGYVYILQAQDFSQTATTDIYDAKYKEDQNTLKTYYEKAQPYFEKLRELKPDERDWKVGLYNVYYNLANITMSQEYADKFKEIESLME